jgi:ribosomal protein S18 acetylase RimI-like enzyme
VTEPRVELRPTIDRLWLEERDRAEPFVHAYALWDLERVPELIRFVSAVRGESTLGYLLFWLGRPPHPLVHWYGTEPGALALAEALPPRPFVAVVPPEVERTVAGARGPVTAHTLVLLARPPGGDLPATDGVRRLTAEDRTPLHEWARGFPDAEVSEYPRVDPDVEPVWAGFDRGSIVGVVRASARLPSSWVLGGVFVQPDARAKGWGKRLVAAAVREAEAQSARAGLYVREERTPAMRLYASLGFRPVARRRAVEAGAGVGL